MEAVMMIEAYQEKRDPALRESLLNRHLGLVHHVARRLRRTLSLEVEVEDLVSAGTLGLMRALDGYDPSRGTAFSTYAMPRIRGAILDELRSQDPMPRSVRRKSRSLRSARSTLRGVLGREPRSDETARELGIETDTLHRWESQREASLHVSFEAVAAPAGGEWEGPAASDEERPEVERKLDSEAETAALRRGLERLAERDRLVVTLYFYEGLKLREIADLLRVTESRVSQIRTRALAALRREVGERLSA